MKKIIVALSLVSILGTVAYAGDDKAKDKKSCAASEKKSCCSKSKTKACEKKTEDTKTDVKPL